MEIKEKEIEEKEVEEKEIEEKEIEEKVDSLVKPLSEERVKNKIIWLVALVFMLGTVSGWGLFRATSSPKTGGGDQAVAQLQEGEAVEVGKIYGAKKADSFADTAKGVVESNEGGVEGTHKLMREGGESQTVHLTSSVLDLDMFIDHQVNIWGETFSSEKVGWLMDVGRAEVLK